MLSITEKRVPIYLDQERTLIFNVNTMVAFEEATGRFFLDTVAKLYDAMKPAIDAYQAREKARREGTPAPPEEKVMNPLAIVRVVPMADLRALVWAALHDYDTRDEPHWPLTITQVGKLLDIDSIPRVFTAFLKGQAKNSPSKEELGESQAERKPTSLTSTPQKTAANGGERSIALPEDAFASPTEK